MASSQCQQAASVTRASVSSILQAGESSQPADPPSPHIGTSPNRPFFAMEPPPRPAIRHGRALSYTPHRPNRLSLSFPVAPSSNSSESTRPTPTSSNQTSFPPTPVETITSPNSEEHGKFLVSLAGQERKVLELKEELTKAEEELRTLKKQYARYEAAKKRAELRHVEPLQTVVTAGGSGEDPSVVPCQSAELDRRKALLNNLKIPKDTRRKFSGAHTRTLSLLSPERSNFHSSQPFPPVPESSSESIANITIPDTSQGLRKISSGRANTRHSYQIGVPLGAKQLAEDLKTGMWTFLEDLRQATVGEEAVNGTSSRTPLDMVLGAPAKNSSRTSLKGSDRGKSPRPMSPRTWETLTGSPPLVDLSGDAEAPAGPRARSPSSIKKSRPLSLAAPPLDDLDDDWGNWDSPISKSQSQTPKSPRWSGSTTVSHPATPSGGHEDSVQITGQNAEEVGTPSKRTDIQWPALDNLSPGALKGNLQRTMSTIMKEWEKTIQPSAEERSDGLPAAGSDAATARMTDDVVMMSR